MQNALKIERIKRKIEQDAEKQKRAKSAGEMALMFMGINKIAYDLLLENPMTGYMNDVILTRILGNEDIEGATRWKDCSQCYVCEKWDKTLIQYKHDDVKVLKRHVSKLNDLHRVIQETVKVQKEKMIERVPESEVKKMYQDDDERDEGFGANLLANVPVAGIEEEESLATATEDKIQTESIYSEEQKANEFEIDAGNAINSVRMDQFKIIRQLP